MRSTQSIRAADARPQTGWLRLLVVALCCCIVGAAALQQWRVRAETLDRSSTDAAMLANSLAQHAIDSFEIADVLLTTFADILKSSPGRSLDDLYHLNTTLEQQLRRVPRIRSLVAYDRHGHQFASSQPQVPDWFDLSDSDLFDAHRTGASDTVRIDAPKLSPSTKDWILIVSRRWEQPDGSFGGIVIATIRVDYLSGFYRNFNIDGVASIALFSGDGIMLARYPLFEDRLGDDFSPQPWFAETLARPAGLVRFRSTVDGQERIYGFRRSEEIPLLMLTGISPSAVLAGWLPGCIAFMACASALAIGVGVSGWRLADKLDARWLSERRWSDLAMTDALTGIRNRRAFDEAARAAWEAGARNGGSLSLLLVDVDHFKAFNDTYGHPAGDGCLRAIGGVLGRTVRRQSDCAARYGGEEFALLLPETVPATGLVIAEQIRQAVLGLGIPHRASGVLPLVSVSIGFASADFGTGREAGADGVERLIEAADRALYIAKLDGRNRVRFQPTVTAFVEAA